MSKKKIPTAKEIFEAAKKAKYDSFGICADPELSETLDKLIAISNTIVKNTKRAK